MVLYSSLGFACICDICYNMGGDGLEEETVTINNRLKIVVCIIIYNIYIIIYVCIIYMYICI